MALRLTEKYHAIDCDLRRTLGVNSAECFAEGPMSPELAAHAVQSAVTWGK